LNQPLTAILSNAQAAQRFLNQNGANLDEVREILGDIVAEDKRAGEVIRRLRLLLQKGEIRLESLDTGHVVDEVLRLLRSDLLNHGVTASTEIEKGLPAMRGDRVQIEQVLLNLVTNACDAMATAESGEKRLLVRARTANGNGVQVSVVDRGCGLLPAELDRVFEPFVTTKKQGMGLGLTVCRTIIDAHGGRLWATNNDDRGASFHFTLPGAEGTSA
jgi:C4-dicarboxylate-specific signal transduction histidine kinase